MAFIIKVYTLCVAMSCIYFGNNGYIRVLYIIMSLWTCGCTYNVYACLLIINITTLPYKLCFFFCDKNDAAFCVRKKKTKTATTCQGHYHRTLRARLFFHILFKCISPDTASHRLIGVGVERTER